MRRGEWRRHGNIVLGDWWPPDSSPEGGGSASRSAADWVIETSDAGGTLQSVTVHWLVCSVWRPLSALTAVPCPSLCSALLQVLGNCIVRLHPFLASG